MERTRRHICWSVSNRGRSAAVEGLLAETWPDAWPGRDEFAWETTVGEQKALNIHVGAGRPMEEFVAMREKRDAGLGMPRLILPSLQTNMRAGHFPEPEENGQSYFKVPINGL